MNEANADKAANVRESLRLLESGMTQKQIAAQLGVHPRTVADYAAQLRGVATRASRRALRERLGKSS